MRTVETGLIMIAQQTYSAPNHPELSLPSQKEKTLAETDQCYRSIERISDQSVWCGWHTSIHRHRLVHCNTNSIPRTGPPSNRPSTLSVSHSGSKCFMRPCENRTRELRRPKAALITTCRTNRIPEGRPVIPKVSELLKSLPVSNFLICPEFSRLLDDIQQRNNGIETQALRSDQCCDYMPSSLLCVVEINNAMSLQMRVMWKRHKHHVQEHQLLLIQGITHFGKL